MNRKLNNKGFTIIEVVLVLAIAALIMLMVFVAWPALQRSQRDTARKNDVSSIVAAIGSYASNNQGQMPTTAAQIQQYAGNLSRIQTINYQAAAGAVSTGASDVDTATVYANSTCGANNAPTAGSARQMAVVTVLESNGTRVAFCQNS